jgi:hypothetical protein
VLIGGVNLFALGLVLSLMLGWSTTTAIFVAAAIVLAYITLGGLTSAIYNEVIQFFIIVAALTPLVIVALIDVGGIGGLADQVRESDLGEAELHAWKGLKIGGDNPLGANWIATVFGLGFVLSFGYWTTNFAEVRPVGPQHVRRSAHPPDRRVPEDLHHGAGGDPGPRGAGDGEGLRQRLDPGHRLQQRHPRR